MLVCHVYKMVMGRCSSAIFRANPFVISWLIINKKIKIRNLNAVTSCTTKADAFLLIQLQGVECGKYVENTSNVFRGMQ